MYRPGSVTLPTCAQVTLLTAKLLSLSQARRSAPSAEAYLSPLRQTTFFHSGLCRWKAKLVGFSVDRRHCTAEFGSYFIRRPIGHQELPKCFLFVVSPTIGISRQEWISLLRMEYTTVDGSKCMNAGRVRRLIRSKTATPNREKRMAETFAGGGQSCATARTIGCGVASATQSAD